MAQCIHAFSNFLSPVACIRTTVTRWNASKQIQLYDVLGQKDIEVKCSLGASELSIQCLPYISKSGAGPVTQRGKEFVSKTLGVFYWLGTTYNIPICQR